MVKSAVQVCVRTRPTANFATDNLHIDVANQTVSAHLPKAPGQMINNQQEDWSYKFDRILHNATQENVYDVCAKDIVESALEGYNGTILAYGQTGAGKTFTMSGGASTYKYRGIIPRAISDVYRHIENHPEKACTVRISYLEIYNETFYDLLRDPRPVSADNTAEVDTGLPVRTSERLQDLAVMEDVKGNLVVKDLSCVVVTSEEEALNLLFAGDTNRTVGLHQLNQQSSRSHCIFTIHIESRSRVESSEKLIVSKLNLVDLAGSERVKKTGSQGGVLKEAKYINKSLTFLEQVVIALSAKHRDHIPFRSCKLTNVLRDSLGGNCKTRLIANIWGEKDQIEETISTLKFATRMMRVSNEASINVQLDPELLLQRYAREITELKQELAMLNTLSNRANVSYEEYTPEEQFDLQQLVQQYAAGDLQDLPMESLRQIRELFRQFRVFAQHLRASGGAQGPAINRQNSHNSIGSSKRAVDGGNATDAGENKADKLGTRSLVGDLDASANGFIVGVAPADARPVISDGAVKAKKSPPKPLALKTDGAPQSAIPSPHSAQQPTEAPKAIPAAITVSSPVISGTIPSEAAAFEEYKRGAGAEHEKVFTENKSQLKAKKQQLKDVTDEVNAAKRTIDGLVERVEIKRQQRELIRQASGAAPAESEEPVDAEEFEIISQMRHMKKAYQDKFAARKQLVAEVSYLQNLCDQSKRTLAQSFLEWYQGQYPTTNASSNAIPVEPKAEKVSGNTSNRTRKSESSHGDKLDDGEAFDQLEMQRVIEEDPDSISFYNARKNVMSALKQQRKVRSPTTGARKATGRS